MTTIIQQNVMRRVRTIHALRTAASGVSASILLLLLALYLIGREVFVARVLQNMPSFSHVSAFAHFFTYAFVHTGALVQALILITIFSGLWFLRELGRVVLIGTPKLT